MLNRMVLFLAKRALGKKLLSLLARPSELARGHRTEILLSLELLIFVLKKFGLLDTPELSGLADQAQAVLLGAIPITLADKARDTQEAVNRIIK